MNQLILHLFGDYVTQSDWMANNKTKSSIAAFSHALCYSLPFLLLDPSWAAFSVILGTHFLIDRFRLARHVVWIKNRVFSPNDYLGILRLSSYEEDGAWINRMTWKNCSATGYPSDVPPWLSVWLLIACDNTLHLAINWAALRWL